MSQPFAVLIVEDDADWLEIYSTKLASEEYSITKARTVNQASKLLSEQEFAAVATDLKLLGADTGGFDILAMVREDSPDTQVIIFTGFGGKQDAFEAMRRGAYDYVTKPLDYEHVKRVIKSAIEVREQKRLFRRTTPDARRIDLPFPEKFVGSSKPVKRILNQVADVVESPKPVLIYGAPGTGKALITETMHLASKRKRFILVNCGVFTETTLERSLFGFQKDAFPGAVEDEEGLLERASGGTLVLDRVSFLSPRLQSHLCAALSRQRVRRIGSTQAIDIDVRVLATSQVDLAHDVAENLFSQELYEYLSATTIELPPLKARKDQQTDDVLLLTGYFLDKYAFDEDHSPTISEEASDLLQSYDFPNNVRELEETIRTAIIKSKSDLIEPRHLPERIQNQRPLNLSIKFLRNSLPQRVICPHGYSLSDQAANIVQAFDSENYVYVPVNADAPGWYQSTLEDTLAQFGLKRYDHVYFANSEDFCPICQPIISSHLAIFDISTSRSITFYELGLANAIGVPCTVLKQRGSQVPQGLGKMTLLEYHDPASLRETILLWFNQLISPS